MKITISGFVGSGKTTLKKALEKEYKIPSFSVGDLRRKFAEKRNMSIQELNRLGERDFSTDISADQYIKKWCREKENFILEGRLAYYFFPESIKIFLLVEKEEGAKRILKAKRKTEEKANSLEEQIKINSQRIISDIKRYYQIYKIKNCYSLDNFDIIIETTNKTKKQVLKLVKAKITDYLQTTNKIKLYLGHPTESKEKIRKWQLSFQQRTNIALINPFFEASPLDPKTEKMGADKYLKMNDELIFKIVQKNLETISDKEIIGAVFIVDNSYTIGTFAEMMANKLMGKLNFTIITHANPHYKKHPFFLYLSDRIFHSPKEFEDYIQKNKKNMFRLLEESRKKTLKDSTFKKIYRNINLNKMWRSE